MVGIQIISSILISGTKLCIIKTIKLYSMKEIIMFTTAEKAEQLRNQLHKTHAMFHTCNNLIIKFNKGDQAKTDSGIIYSIINNLNDRNGKENMGR